ncbi:MAG: flagellar hook assembly protein FlgD [Myxococcota bacterium]|jgi:flagellar hook assembly protein FlgD
MSFAIGNEFGLQSAIDAEDQRKKDDADLGRTDFLTMLVAQLEHQDPLNPQDASEFSAQLAQFSSLEQLISMKVSLDSLVATQGSGDEKRDARSEDLIASNLLNKEVAVFDDRFEAPAQGETETIHFYLDGPASNVDLNVHDDSGRLLYTIPAVKLDEDGTPSASPWDSGVNSFEWQRPAGSEDYVHGPSETFLQVSAQLGNDDVRGEGVAIGRVVSSTLGFDASVLQLSNGRRVDLENVFEVREVSQAGI